MGGESGLGRQPFVCSHDELPAVRRCPPPACCPLTTACLLPADHRSRAGYRSISTRRSATGSSSPSPLLWCVPAPPYDVQLTLADPRRHPAPLRRRPSSILTEGTDPRCHSRTVRGPDTSSYVYILTPRGHPGAPSPAPRSCARQPRTRPSRPRTTPPSRSTSPPPSPRGRTSRTARPRATRRAPRRIRSPTPPPWTA